VDQSIGHKQTTTDNDIQCNSAPPAVVHHQDVVTCGANSISIKVKQFIFCKEKSGGKSEGDSGGESIVPEIKQRQADAEQSQQKQ
jgi:hypothetical protein